MWGGGEGRGRAVARAGGRAGGRAARRAIGTRYNRSGRRQGMRASGTGDAGLHVRKRAVGWEGASGWAMPLPSPEARVALRSRNHRARNFRARLPRFERAPSACGRLVVIAITEHQQPIANRHRRSVDHPCANIDQLSLAIPDHIRSSVIVNRQRRIERSVVDHQSSSVVGRRPSHSSTSRWVIGNRSPIMDHR